MISASGQSGTDICPLVADLRRSVTTAVSCHILRLEWKPCNPVGPCLPAKRVRLWARNVVGEGPARGRALWVVSLWASHRVPNTAFNQMGYDKKQLKEVTKPFYDSWGKRIEPVGSISLSVSFGSLRNARTEVVTFDVVDIRYPYTAIFGRGLLNIFDVALHSVYLCLKVPASLGVISVHDNQKDA
jgi:hypothetical protein